MDAVQLLKKDHDEVKALLKQLVELKGDDIDEKRRLSQRIIRELMVHERIEEDLFYPAYKQAADEKGKDLIAESKEEHHVVDTIMDELETVDLEAREFDAKMKVLKENVEHHIQEEEEKMFPKARELLGAEKLTSLGEEMNELKQSLLREVKPRREQQV